MAEEMRMQRVGHGPQFPIPGAVDGEAGRAELALLAAVAGDVYRRGRAGRELSRDIPGICRSLRANRRTRWNPEQRIRDRASVNA